MLLIQAKEYPNTAPLHTLAPIISVSLSFVSSAAPLLLEEAICPILMASRNAKESVLQGAHVCEHILNHLQLTKCEQSIKVSCTKHIVLESTPDTLQPVRDAFLPLTATHPR